MAVCALSAAKAWIRLRSAAAALPRLNLSKFAWFYILFAPAVALLYVYNMICSLLGTEIVWRQIRYRLISPNETRVLGGV